jgi:hypothetical protein
MLAGCVPTSTGNGQGGAGGKGDNTGSGGSIGSGGSLGGGSGSGGKNGSGGSSGSGSGGSLGGGSGSGGKDGSGGSLGGGSGGTSGMGLGGTSGSGGGSGGQAGTGGASSGGSGGLSSPNGGSTGSGGRTSAGTGGTNTGGAAGGTGTGACSAAPSLTGLKIDANPKSVLSGFVSWTTDVAADSAVQFGEGKYEWEVSDSATVTSHKVLVIGMHANTSYQIKAMSSANGCSGNATGTFKTGALPSQVPTASVTINDTTKSQPGWTLMNVILSSSSMGPISNSPAAAVMYDDAGQPVWYYIDGTTPDFGGAIATHLTDKGVLIGPVVSQSGAGESPREVDFAGNTIWECKDPLCGGSGGLTHETIKLSNGDHVVARWKALSGTNIDSDPTFEELDSTGKVVWSLTFSKLVPKPSSASGDWCHGNSITIDIAKDVVYANCRFMGLIKTSYKNPSSLIWYLPASYGKATGTLTFSPTTSQYSDTHDPEIHDDGTILFFDNGGYSTSVMPGGTTTYHSRAVEYQIDETKKTATLVWEFPGNFTVDSWYQNNWYNSYYGDANRQPNGNVLITSGSVSTNAGDARVFEVTKADGKVVWEFRLPSSVGVYRADRITPPLVHAVTAP